MYIGIDIGGTKTAVVLGNEQAEIKKKIKFDTSDREETIKRIIAAAETIMNGKVQAIGISCGGPLDSKKGVILSPPNLKGWDQVEITGLLSHRFKRPVFLQNDADAGVLAEWYFGNAKGYRHAIFLTFGTGFGAGLILDGRLYSGASGGAGEIGHVRLFQDGHTGYGKKGSVEGYCSGSGIAQYRMGSAKELAQKAYAGDETAVRIYKETGANLGRSLAILVDILNPEVIVLGSIFTRAEELMREAMIKKLREEALEVNYSAVVIKPSKLGEKIGDTAAICAAINGWNSRLEKV